MIQKEVNVISPDTQQQIIDNIEFNILLQNDEFIAIDKPSGILVHRTGISTDRVFVLQKLRDQIQQYIYTIHRLDRATSGVLVFAFNSEAQKHISRQFEAKTVSKTYFAMVRGWTDEDGTIDHPVPDDRGRSRSAITHFRRIATGELDVAIGRYKSARYSLVELKPETGRKHQIRRHMRHIAHPIIGDVNYGDRHHNHYFWEHLNLQRLMLHASELQLDNPKNEQRLNIHCPLPNAWHSLFQQLNWPTEL